MICKRLVAAGLIVLITDVPISRAEIIPAARRATWEGRVGIPGGIPDSFGKTISQTVSVGASRATVQTALQSAAANTVVVMPAGAYSWTGTLDWLDVANGVVLRGEAGTVVTWSDYSQTGMNMRGVTYDEPAFSVEANLTANATKDGTTLTVSSVPSWVQVGDLIGVDQLDDSAIANGDGFNLRTFLGNGQRNISQVNKVLAKDSTTITVETPWVWDFTTANTAQIFQPGYVPTTDSPGTGWGIEKIKFTFTFGPSSDEHPITFFMCYQCYLKDVELDNMPSGRGVITYYSYQCEFRRLYIHDSHSYAGGQGYCLDINDSTCSSLIEDNIFEDYHVGVTVRYGSVGNVIAYNYFGNSSAAASALQTAAMSTHGCHALMNLFEGNWTNDKVLCDFTHGSASHNTVFRCVVEGREYGDGDATAISDEYYNRYWNFVGNILGVNGLHNKGVAHQGSQSPGGSGTIWRMGGIVNINSDYSTFDTWSGTSGMNVIMHGNYDFVNDAIQWDQAPGQSIADQTLPNSYYLSSEPAYFKACPWPPYSPASVTTAALSPTNIPAGHRIIHGTDPPDDANPVSHAPVARFGQQGGGRGGRR